MIRFAVIPVSEDTLRNSGAVGIGIIVFVAALIALTKFVFLPIADRLKAMSEANASAAASYAESSRLNESLVRELRSETQSSERRLHRQDEANARHEAANERQATLIKEMRST